MMPLKSLCFALPSVVDSYSFSIPNFRLRPLTVSSLINQLASETILDCPISSLMSG